MWIEDFSLWFLRAFVLAFGLLWGSFLNVVIHRVPLGLSVVRPASRCPHCKTPIRAWHNLPLLGWLILRGRARCCGAKVSARYPAVEAIGGLAALAVLEVLVLRLPRGTALEMSALVFAVDLALVLGLVAVTFIDVEHMIVPDRLSIGGTVLGLATYFLRGLTITDAVIGAVVGFAAIAVVMEGYARLRGKQGMGLGDAKLLMLAGAWFGWQGALFVLGAAAIQGTLVALAVMLVRGRIEEPEAVRREREEVLAAIAALPEEERAAAEAEWAKDPIAEEAGPGLQSRMAFGPFLALATIECLFFGRELMDAYLAAIAVE